MLLLLLFIIYYSPLTQLFVFSGLAQVTSVQ